MKTLRGGGYVIVFRHGATHADQADTDPLNPATVTQQRQLNDQGRALARAIGEAIRTLNIPVGLVQGSMFNRAETGTLLGFGAVMATRDISEDGLFVSHKLSIVDAFGKDWFDVREGEASMFKPDGAGYKPVLRIQAGDWEKLAKATN